MAEPTSDNESILTEDFAVKFNDLCRDKVLTKMEGKVVNSNAYNGTSAAAVDRYVSKIRQAPRDTESIRTEDFQTEFRKSLLDEKDENNLLWTSQIVNRIQQPNYYSKEDSILTEEFESRFQSLMLRGTPNNNNNNNTTTTGGALNLSLSYEDLSTLGESASDVECPRQRTSTIPRAMDLLQSTDHSQTKSSGSHGSLSNISPMRRDIMSKFLEKYGNTLGENSTTKFSKQLVSRDPLMTSSLKRNWTKSAALVASKPPSTTWLRQTANRHSIAVPRHQISPIPETKNFSDDDISAEIRNKSEQIQREIQLERLRRNQQNSQTVTSTTAAGGGPYHQQRTTAVIVKNIGSSLTPRETLDEKMKEVDRLGNSLRQAQNEKQRLLGELNQLQDTLKRYKAEVRISSKLIQDRRSKADGAHTELMLAEANRDSTQKCLDDLNLELTKKKQQLKDLENTLIRRVEEVKGLQDIGLTKEEIESVIAERNELYEIIKLSEESENQKYELEKQLTAAREDLTIEQRRFRERIIALEEELEASLDKISSLQMDKDNMFQDISILESRNKSLCMEMEQLSMENHQIAKECDDLKHEVQRNHLVLKEESEINISRLKEELQKALNQQKESEKENLNLKTDLTNLKNENENIKKENIRLEHELNETAHQRDEIHRNSQQKIQTLIKDHEAILVACQEEHEQALKHHVNNSRSEKEVAHNDALEQVKYSYETELRNLHGLNQELLDENQSLKQRIKKQEERMQEFLQDNEFDEKAKLQRAVKRERENWERDQEEKWIREFANLKRETKEIVEKAQRELHDEQGRAQAIQKDLEIAIKNLRETEESLRKTQSDKEGQLEFTQKNWEKELHSVQQEYQKTIQQLELTLQQKEQALQEGIEDRRTLDGRYLELQNSLRKLGMTVIGEVREECRRMMDIIKVDLPKFKHERENIAVDHVNEAVWDSLANMRACSDEFHRFCMELQSERDLVKQKLVENDETLNQELSQLKEKLNEEKTREIAQFKEQMVKDHVEEIDRLVAQQQNTTHDLLVQREKELRDLRRSMSQWKEETTEKIANQLQQEFRLEYERRIAKVSDGKNLSKDRSGTPQPMLLLSLDNNPVQVINQLKKMVQKLREENISLRKVLVNKHVNENVQVTDSDEGVGKHSRQQSPSRRHKGVPSNSGPSSSNHSDLRALMNRSRATSESKTVSPCPGRQTPQIPEKLHKSDMNGSRPLSQTSSTGYPINYVASPAMAASVASGFHNSNRCSPVVMTGLPIHHRSDTDYKN